jgi:phosphoribosylformylglycinamidine synthase subunit PurL
VCAQDPLLGGKWVVAEACRNVAAAGGLPLALTDCLNFGDPERPEVWQQLTGVVEGIREACLALGVPVISGNVSLYNETEGAPILPTPVVGVVGLVDNPAHVGRASLQPDQSIWLLGPLAGGLGCSEYAESLDLPRSAPPPIDLDLEGRVQAVARELVARGIAPTATDVADGGIVVALAELCLAGGVGAQCSDEWTHHATEPVEGVLFSEAPSRIILGVAPAHDNDVTALASLHHVPITRLGASGGDSFVIGDLLEISLDDARSRWASALDHLSSE